METQRYLARQTWGGWPISPESITPITHHSVFSLSGGAPRLAVFETRARPPTRHLQAATHVHPSQTSSFDFPILPILPARLKRYSGSGDLHFITCSCYRRQPFLGTAGRRDLFLKVLERVRRRYSFVVLGYVIMPEHVHLLVSGPQRGRLSTVVQALKLSFTRRVLRQSPKSRQKSLWPAPTHIWQPRYYDFNVWTERKRIEKLRYMHRNPVKRGL